MKTHENNNTAPAATMPGDKSNNNGSRVADKMQICGNEIVLIADVANATPYSPWGGWIMTLSELNFFKHEIQDADKYDNVGEKWGVSISELVFKFERMPAASKMDMFHHVVEAWAFHKHDFRDFLISRRFVFSPINEVEEEKDFLLAPRLRSGEIVVNREPSHAKPSDFDAILHALCRVSSNNQQFIEQEVQFPGEIGFTTCVETSEADDIVFAQRKGRSGLSRFVRGKSPQKSKSVFLVLKRESTQKYVLITGFIGGKPEPEPWDSRAFAHKPNPDMASAQARAFWAGHALVWDEKSIVPGTETTTAPICF